MSLAFEDGVLRGRTDDLPSVLEAMDRRGLGAIALASPGGALTGLVTDAAVRARLAAGPAEPLPTLEAVLDRAPPSLPITASAEAVTAHLDERRVRYAVATDLAGRPAGLWAAHRLPGRALLTEALIMAGGQGARLRPFTTSVPKPLLMVGESPILEIIIRHLVRSGVSRITLAVNYLSEKIRAYFQDGRNHGVELRYIEEREALGTAGALRLLSPPESGSVLMMNADLLTDLNVRALADAHALSGAALTIGLVPHRVEIPYGVVHTEGTTVRGIAEKPTHAVWINGGIYALGPDALAAVSDRGAMDMPALIEKLLAAGSAVTAFPMRERWLDIGQLQDYQRAVRDAVTINAITPSEGAAT